MYTWGYIIENVCNKMNITRSDANDLGLTSRFPYYANEAMTQICSAVKPKLSYGTIKVTESAVDKAINLLSLDTDNTKNVFLVSGDFTEFVAFSDDVPQFKSDRILYDNVPYDTNQFVEAHDDVLQYMNYSQVVCHVPGTYIIPFNARWFFFTQNMSDSTVLSVPADILDAIPSYIVSQCMKIDDETKAAIFRNEYEMALARIDDTSFKTQRTFNIGGGW